MFEVNLDKKTYGILWIMASRQGKNNIEDTSTWEQTICFSTTEYAGMPLRITELFESLLQQLQQAWAENFQASESRLTLMVS